MKKIILLSTLHTQHDNQSPTLCVQLDHNNPIVLIDDIDCTSATIQLVPQGINHVAYVIDDIKHARNNARTRTITINISNQHDDVTLDCSVHTCAHQPMTLTTTQHHVKNTGKSSVLVRIAAQEASIVTCKGLIRIEAGNEKAHAHLSIRGLMLGDDAHIIAEPKLEVLTDDVICKHTASIQPLHEDQCFYLQGVGITLVNAERMLIDAFLGDYRE